MGRRDGVARALGGQASRMTPRTRRPPRLTTTTRPRTPRRAGGRYLHIEIPGGRARCRPSEVDDDAESKHPFDDQHHVRRRSGTTNTTSTPSQRDDRGAPGQRHSSALTSGRARWRARLRAPRRSSRLRVRPRVATPTGAAMSGRANALMSSGVTKSRPDNHAHARDVRSNAVAPRGDAPSDTDGELRVARHRSTM